MINEKDKMTKSKAIIIFKNENIKLNKNITYASKNRSVDRYWANPNFDVLEEDWYLILNDSICGELHLFRIPKKEISFDKLIPRNDKKNLIDLQIMYGDTTFTDMRSKLGFERYFVKTVKY